MTKGVCVLYSFVFIGTNSCYSKEFIAALHLQSSRIARETSSTNAAQNLVNKVSINTPRQNYNCTCLSIYLSQVIPAIYHQSICNDHSTAHKHQ